MGGGDGQGGVVRSGIVPGAIRTRPPLPEGHPLRTVAAETTVGTPLLAINIETEVTKHPIPFIVLPLVPIRTRPPLPEGHPLRTVAAETQGEVLVNQQGYYYSFHYHNHHHIP